MVKHVQVPFTLANGKKVLVDEGLVDILAALRDRGVRTQYSCEGNPYTKEAYILADMTFRKLLRKVYWRYWRGGYSPESRALIRKFIKGGKELDIAVLTKDHWNQLMRLTLTARQAKGAGFMIERCWNSKHKSRMVLRWPMHLNDKILKLLEETPWT